MMIDTDIEPKVLLDVIIKELMTGVRTGKKEIKLSIYK